MTRVKKRRPGADILCGCPPRLERLELH